MSNRISVIGTGRLGLSFALLAAQRGYGVIGQDTRADYVDALYNKTYTSSEPLITEYVSSCTSFIPTVDLEAAVLYADILFCFVATPSLSDGSYDHSAIDSVVSDLQELHVKGHDMSNKILVIGCTTMPGYTDTVSSRLESTGMQVAYNPEFIAQGTIIKDLQTADMVLIGCTQDSTYHALQGIYRTIMTKEPVFNKMSPKAAEIVKIATNCFLTTKVAFANMIGEIVINSGIESEVSTVLQAIGDDSRIGNKFLRYGFGFGGPCLVRDMRAIGVHAKDVGVVHRLPVTVDQSNEIHYQYLLNYYINNNPDGLPYVFTQLAYKKGTDILTESQQYRLCKDLLIAGYHVDINETPAIVAQVQQELAEYKDKITYGTFTGINITL